MIMSDVAHEVVHEAAHSAERSVHWFSSSPDGSPPFVFALINFSILLIVLFFVLRKPIAKFVSERHGAVRREWDAVTTMRAQEESQLAEIGKRIERLDQEIAEIRETARRQAELERKEILANAQAEAKRLIDSADQAVAREVERARQSLEKEVVDAALAAAETLIKRGATDQDQSRIEESYVASMSSAENRT